MLTHIFKCPKCGSEIAFRSLGFKSRVKCKQCEHQYIVVKNFPLRIIETFLLLSLASGIMLFVLPDMWSNQFVTIGVFCILLIGGNIVFDAFMNNIVKYKNYYTLVERTMPINHKN